MNTKQGDLLNTQGNAENNPKQNYPLTEREQIKGTPFTLIKHEDKYFAVMGDHRITENSKTKEETLKWIEDNRWLVMINMIAIAVEKLSVANEEYTLWKRKNLKEEVNQEPTEQL